MSEIVIDPEFTKDLEKNNMGFMNTAQDVNGSLGALKNKVKSNFKGPASDAMLDYCEKLEGDFGGVLGEFIKKNISSLKVLEENFERVDKANAKAFEFMPSGKGSSPIYPNMSTGATSPGAAKAPGYQHK